jgi:hypothetical protein
VEKSLEVQAKVDGGNIGGGGQEREGKGGGDVPPRKRRKSLASLPAERKALKGRKAS